MNSMAAVFDTLQYAKRLKEAGFTDQQAEVQAEAMVELIDDKLATKQDLKELEYRLTIKVGGFLVVGITVLVTLMKLFHL